VTECHDLRVARHRVALLVGIYLAVLVLLTLPATLLMFDRDVPPVFAVLLGLMLAQTAIVALLIPVRIYLVLRRRRRRDQP